MDQGPDAFHLDALRQRFPATRLVAGGAPGDASTSAATAGERTFEVVQTDADAAAPAGPAGSAAAVPPPGAGPPLTLYVTLDAAFPQSAPRCRTAMGVAVASAAPWDGGRSLLSEAVDGAFATLRALWGGLRPPSAADLPSLRGLPDDVLDDLVSNPLCLAAYAFQLPYCRALRDAGAATIDAVAAQAAENLALQPAVEALEAEVRALQATVRERAAELALARAAAADVAPLLTVSGLLRAAAAELAECDALAAPAAERIAALPAGTALPSGALEEYVELRAKFHARELKRRAFAAANGVAL